MPIYEYRCKDCQTKFSVLRSMSQADAPIACERCAGVNTARVLSTFYAHGEGGALSGAGGGCGSCEGGSCGSCGHSHN